MNKKAGFTMMEFLLVVGIIAILSYMTVPLGINFYRSQVVETARTNLLEVLGKARQNAVLMKGDSRYGVLVDTMNGSLSTYTLYKGNSFGSKDDDFDEVYTQPPGITISAVGTSNLTSGDINFNKLSGTTNATGTITITHSGGEARAIIIDIFGNAYATSTTN